MAKLFGIIPYGGSSKLGQLVKDVGTVGEGFMGQALKSKNADDKRTADLEDAVTQATLSAAINLDSKYPAFKAAEETRIKKYESLKNNSAVGPEVAKWAYFQPGFLDNDNYLENAFQYASSNPRYKHSGGVEPSEQYQENINQFQNTVRGKFGDSHGGNMSSLFVGEATQPTTPTTIDSTQTDTTSITTDLTGSTQTDTGAEGNFTTSMIPPMKSKTVSQQKDKIWSTVLGYASQGVQPEQLLANNIITKPEYDIWMKSSGSGDLRLSAMEMATAASPELMQALLSNDKEAASNAYAKIQAMTNVLYAGQSAALANVNMTGGGASETIDNKTYVPVGSMTPDTSEKIYGVKTGDATEYYVKRNGVFLKATNENGKTIVEGDKDFNKQKISYSEDGGLLINGQPFIPG